MALPPTAADDDGDGDDVHVTTTCEKRGSLRESASRSGERERLSAVRECCLNYPAPRSEFEFSGKGQGCLSQVLCERMGGDGGVKLTNVAPPLGSEMKLRMGFGPRHCQLSLLEGFAAAAMWL